MKITPFKIEKYFDNNHVVLYPTLIQVNDKNYLVDCGYEETFPGEKTVIANDAVVFENGELNLANPSFTLDMKEAVRSVEKIRNLKPARLICYHGGVVKDHLYERLNELVLKYKHDT